MPSLPATKPGAVRVKVKLTMLFSLTADLTVYDAPSSASSMEQPSAKKDSLSSSKPWFSSGSDDHSAGRPAPGKKTLVLNWHVVRKPLSPSAQRPTSAWARTLRCCK